jgi:hypothetical protein
MGQDNVSDNRGADPVEGTRVFIYLFIRKVWCVKSMLVSYIKQVSISVFFKNTFIVFDVHVAMHHEKSL